MGKTEFLQKWEEATKAFNEADRATQAVANGQVQDADAAILAARNAIDQIEEAIRSADV